jgi:hypothetical protein
MKLLVMQISPESAEHYQGIKITSRPFQNVAEFRYFGKTAVS